jgi:hypothetical protein
MRSGEESECHLGNELMTIRIPDYLMLAVAPVLIVGELRRASRLPFGYPSALRGLDPRRALPESAFMERRWNKFFRAEIVLIRPFHDPNHRPPRSRTESQCAELRQNYEDFELSITPA